MTSVGDGGGGVLQWHCQGFLGVARVPTDSPKKIAAFQGHHRTNAGYEGGYFQTVINVQVLRQ